MVVLGDVEVGGEGFDGVGFGGGDGEGFDGAELLVGLFLEGFGCGSVFEVRMFGVRVALCGRGRAGGEGGGFGCGSHCGEVLAEVAVELGYEGGQCGL